MSGVAPAVQLRAYQPRDRDACVAVLRAVRAEGGTYPSPVTCGPTDADIAAWLDASDARWRVVATRGDDTAIGHVQLVTADPSRSSLAAHLADTGTPVEWELERLFVHPAAAGGGTGRALLDAAVARSNGAPVGLWVLTTQRAAIALYRSAGWTYHSIYDHRAGPLEVYVHPPQAHT